HVLARRGWTVARVAGAGAVADGLREGEPRLVVIQEDPSGTGSKACRALRESAQRPPYVIGIAWRHDPAALRRLAQAGVDDVIGAPFEIWEAETRVLLAEARIGAPEHPVEAAADYARIIDEIKRRLHIQQAFLEGLFESAPEGIVILDRDNRVVRINSEFTRVFGY